MLSLIPFFIILIWLFILQMDYNEFKAKIEKDISSQKIKNKASENDWFNYSVPEESKPIIEQEIIQEVHSIPDEMPEEEVAPVVEKEQSSFEKMFLGNIFNKIGAFALIVGFAIFIKLVSPYIVFTPTMQISTGFMAGLLMILGGFKLHKNEMKSYAEVLLGTGFAIVFVSTYCGTSLYHLFSVSVASIIGFCLIIATYITAEKIKSFSTLAIGLIGGYLNPFYINTNISADFLFGYLIFLNLLSIIYVYKNKDKLILNIINLLLTTFIVSFFAGFKHFEINIISPVLLWSMYLVNDLLLLKKDSTRALKDKNNVLGWMNLIIFAYFSRIIFHAQQDNIVGYIMLGASIIYLCLSYLFKPKENGLFRPYLYSFIILIATVTYFLLTGTNRVVAWSVEGLIIALFSNKYNLKYLSNWVLSYSLLSITGIFFVKNAIVYQDIQNYIPILNFRTVLFGVPILMTYLSSLLLKKNGDCKISQVLKFVYISMIYLFVTFELNLILLKMAFMNNIDKAFINFTKYMCNSIIGLIYAMQMKRIYNYIKYDLFNFASYSLFGISLIFLLCNGMHYSPINMFYPIVNIRFVAFIAAIVSGLMYFKWTKSEIYNYLSIFIGLLLIHVETYDYFTKHNLFEQMPVAISIAWILYAGIIILLGILKNIKSLKLTGIWITIIAILKILFVDLANMASIYKTIAFLTIGIILMLVSYFYTKRKEE